MGSLVIVTPVGIIAFLVYLLFSTKAAGWVVLSSLAVWNIFVFVKSFLLYIAFLNGTSLRTEEIIATSTQPFVASFTFIAIVIILLVDLNKLHLLWFYPCVSVIFDFTIGTRTVKKLEESDKKNGPYC